MRFCIKFKLAYQYEINAVIGNNFLCGGAANTEIQIMCIDGRK